MVPTKINQDDCPDPRGCTNPKGDEDGPGAVREGFLEEL